MSESAENTRMHARLAFGNEAYARLALVGVGDEAAADGTTAHAALLGTLPAVGVTEDEVDVAFDGVP